MAVQDDLRRLSQLDSIYLGHALYSNVTGFAFSTWHKGRLQQANDGNWTFRSISSDGTVVGFQLGPPTANWTSWETPTAGITVQIQINQSFAVPNGSITLGIGSVFLQQQLPQELTN